MPGVRKQLTSMHVMNHELITTTVQATLDAIRESVRADDSQLALIIREPARAHPSVGQLLEVLHAEPSLAIFDGRMQVIANLAARVEIGDLADWLIRRGLEVGPAQAVANLQRYLDVTEIPFSMILGLNGLEVDRSCDLGAGIVLMPWDHLPDAYRKDMIYPGFLPWIAFKGPMAVVVRQVMLPKLHVSEEERGDVMTFPDESELRDAILCIGVVGPFAPEIFGSWLAAPPWAPVKLTPGSLSPLEGRPRRDVWTEEHYQAASRIFQSFRALDAKRKDALRLPLQRLSMAMRRRSNVDSAVDLGIALEALFLSDENRSELTFRLCLRVARFMEQDSGRRLTLFQLVGDLYSLRSTAVHTGRLRNHFKGRLTSKVLDEGFRLTANAISRILVEGAPDWNSVQLQ
jgi:Apea-like HEPN